MRKMIPALAIVLMAGTAMAAVPRSAIEAQDRKWETAANAGDAAALVALYTSNATVMPPGAPAAMGHAAIEQTFRGMLSSGLKDFVLHTGSLAEFGPAVREIGTFTVQAPGPSGQPAATLSGKYVVIWRHEGGAWKLDTDIWNLDH